MIFLDWILLVLWLGLTLAGFWKGALRLVLGLGGLVAGVWLGSLLGGEVAAWLEPSLGHPWLAALLGRAVVLVGCVVIGLLAAWGLDRTLRAIGLGWLNRLAGALLTGTVTAVALGAFLMTAARLVPGLDSAIEGSVIAGLLMRVVSALLNG